MIDDVSNALKSMLDDPAIEGGCKELFDAGVRFDRPGDHFTPTQSATVNLFLYDIREDSSLRNNQPVIDHDNRGRGLRGRGTVVNHCAGTLYQDE